MDLLGQKLSEQLFSPYGSAGKLNISYAVYMQVIAALTDFHEDSPKQRLRSLRYDIKLCIRAFFYENQEQ